MLKKEVENVPQQSNEEMKKEILDTNHNEMIKKSQRSKTNYYHPQITPLPMMMSKLFLGSPVPFQPHIYPPVGYSQFTPSVQVLGTTYYYHHMPLVPLSTSTPLVYPEVNSKPSMTSPPITSEISSTETYSTTTNCGAPSEQSWSKPNVTTRLKSSTPASTTVSSRSSSPYMSNPTSVICNQQQILRMIQLEVESLFNESYLRSNNYLHRLISRSRDGYISIKFIAQINQIRKLVKDPQLLLNAIQLSTRLEICPHGNKVRKRDFQLRRLLSTTPEISFLLLFDLDKDLAEMKSLLSVFSKFGKILQVRTIPAKQPVPGYLRCCLKAVPQLGEVNCATIEFENEKESHEACDWVTQNAEYNGILISPHPKKAFETQQNGKQKSINKEKKSKKSLKKLFTLQSNQGNSMDSGLECCNSSTDSTDCDVILNEVESCLVDEK